MPCLGAVAGCLGGYSVIVLASVVNKLSIAAAFKAYGSLSEIVRKRKFLKVEWFPRL